MIIKKSKKNNKTNRRVRKNTWRKTYKMGGGSNRVARAATRAAQAAPTLPSQIGRAHV